MARIQIADATATQLAEFASVSMGIPDVKFRDGKAAILAKLAQAGYAEDFIEVEDAALAKPVTAAAAVDSDGGKPRKMMTIMIPMQEMPGSEGKEPVPVGVNGKVMLIPRGKQVSVPAEYVHALENARKASPVTDENGKLTGMTEVPSYPFMVMPSAA